MVWLHTPWLLTVSFHLSRFKCFHITDILSLRTISNAYLILLFCECCKTIYFNHKVSFIILESTLSSHRGAEAPGQPLSRQHDSRCDHDSSNPFNEPDEPEPQTPGNPFDEPDQDADVQPDPEPPKPRQRKGVRPVDMSKYLYADNAHNEDEELDE